MGVGSMSAAATSVNLGQSVLRLVKGEGGSRSPQDEDDGRLTSASDVLRWTPTRPSINCVWRYLTSVIRREPELSNAAPQQIDQIKVEIAKLIKQVADQNDRIETLERGIRRKNLVMKVIKDDVNEKKEETKEKVCTIMERLGITLDKKIEIDEVRRLGGRINVGEYKERERESDIKEYKEPERIRYMVKQKF
ncbi:hypothetical protein FQA39_LY10252 [Lamprigera yunnana]|nr:hypothetical protein FQA39_LY10252 [Lamprigera yunnana]